MNWEWAKTLIVIVVALVLWLVPLAFWEEVWSMLREWRGK